MLAIALLSSLVAGTLMAFNVLHKLRYVKSVKRQTVAEKKTVVRSNVRPY